MNQKIVFGILVLWTIATVGLVNYQNSAYQSFVSQNPDIDFTSWAQYGFGPLASLSVFWLVAVWAAEIVTIAENWRDHKKALLGAWR